MWAMVDTTEAGAAPVPGLAELAGAGCQAARARGDGPALEEGLAAMGRELGNAASDDVKLRPAFWCDFEAVSATWEAALQQTPWTSGMLTAASVEWCLRQERSAVGQRLLEKRGRDRGAAERAHRGMVPVGRHGLGDGGQRPEAECGGKEGRGEFAHGSRPFQSGRPDNETESLPVQKVFPPIRPMNELVMCAATGPRLPWPHQQAGRHAMPQMKTRSLRHLRRTPLLLIVPLLALLAVMSLGGGGPGRAGNTAASGFDHALDSTLVLREDDEGRGFLGSATLWGDGDRVVTAAHVVKGRRSVIVEDRHGRSAPPWHGH